MLATLLTGCTILRPHAWPAESHKIILTFDDGPNPQTTPPLLTVLRRQNVRATFCLIGSNVEKYPDLVRHIASERHEIVNHTWHHRHRDLLSGYPEEMAATDRSIAEALKNPGFHTTRTRPPYGIVTPAVRKAGKTIAWLTFFIDESGASGPKAARKLSAIRQRLLNHRGGAIVLHEMRFTTSAASNGPEKSWLPDAVDELINWARENGFSFATYEDAP